MEDNSQLLSASKLLSSAQNIVIILPPDPGLDLVSAGLGLHQSLIHSGKGSVIGCGSEVHFNQDLPGIEMVTSSIGAKNLIISLDYREDDLEKVDYDIRSDGKFYLLIKPKAGSPAPDASTVKYSYSGASGDLVIVLGVSALEELGKIYANEKKFIDEAKILSLNLTQKPSAFTPSTLHQPSGSYCELVTSLLNQSSLTTSSEANQNLLLGIYRESQNLTSPRVTADTFSAIAFLMRQGGQLPNQLKNTSKLTPPPFFEPNPSTSSDLNSENIPDPIDDQGMSPPIPHDWTRPKIFRATDL